MSVTSAKANAFWEPLLTTLWPEDVTIDMHIILPTMLYTVPREINPADYPDRTALELESMRYHSMCCICDAKVADQWVLSGIRCVFGKQEIRNRFTMFRTSFMSVEICGACAAELGCDDLAKLHSDHITINKLLNFMEQQSLDLRKDLICVDMSVEKFFECLMLRLRTLNNKMMNIFGQMQNRCAFCKKRCPKLCCSKCCFVHYCDDKCAKKNWKNHKVECDFLQKNSLFMAPQYQIRIK